MAVAAMPMIVMMVIVWPRAAMMVGKAEDGVCAAHQQAGGECRDDCSRDRRNFSTSILGGPLRPLW